MFRNQYDNDVTIWSPQGRLYQVEYAMEAVKLGTATVGLKNPNYAVLVALCRHSTDSDTLQRKIMPIDKHIGMSISGLTADARQVGLYLRTECMTYRHTYASEYPVQRLVTTLGNKLQSSTQRYDRRPYGVGMLVVGYDELGPHLYQVMPSANVLNCKAMALGARSQSARTYLERHLESFPKTTKDELICHGIQAIRSALGSEEASKDLKINVAVVGKHQPFKPLSDEDNLHYLNMARDAQPPEHDSDEDGNLEARPAVSTEALDTMLGH